MDGRDLFISHSSADAEVARALRADLEAAGFSAWMAPDDVVGTETWAEQILDAIARCRAMVVLISSNANASTHVSREVNLALGRQRPVLPIRIEAVAPTGSLEYLLSLVQRVDAFPPPISDHRDRIIRRLEALLRPNATPPPPPLEPVVKHPGPETEHAGDGQPTPTEPAPKPRRPRTKSAAGTTRRRPVAIGPGAVIDGFTLETLLGEGGMGTVYRARQAEPNRAVALKVIRPDHAADESYRRRFLAEKDTLAALEHPAIVPIYAAGDDHGVLYIAMRLVDGADLQGRIAAEGRLSLRETVQILRPIADAIDHAHAMGVIHRDLKPSNIILDRDGRPYLTDFGLGKRVERVSQMTQQGVALGTLDYMAPEQFTGNAPAELANRIDIYALGCVAYTCLSGRPPFAKDTPEQLMYAHANERPAAIQTIRPELPKSVDDVLQRALAKDPAKRFGTAMELVSALEAAFSSNEMGQTRKIVVAGSGLDRVRRLVRANMPVAVIGGALASIAIVVFVAAGIGPGPSPSPSPGHSTTVVTARPGTPAPPVANLRATAVSPTVVGLSWEGGAGVDRFDLYRDGVLILHLDPVSRSVQDFVRPGTSYVYRIEAVQGAATSGQMESRVTMPSSAATSTANVGRLWHVALTYVESTYKNPATSETWDLTTSCASGACATSVDEVHGNAVTGELVPEAGVYSGTLEYSFDDATCGKTNVRDTIELSVDAGSYAADGVFRADKLTGTIDETATSPTCKDGGATITVILTPDLDEVDITNAVDEGLDCATADASTFWPDALASMSCTRAGVTGSVTFRIYESAAAAREALNRFLDSRQVKSGLGCFAAGDATGYGPYFLKSSAAGDVACGGRDNDPANPNARIYVWTHWATGMVGYANWDDGAALTTWWTDHRHWLAAGLE